MELEHNMTDWNGSWAHFCTFV